MSQPMISLIKLVTNVLINNHTLALLNKWEGRGDCMRDSDSCVRSGNETSRSVSTNQNISDSLLHVYVCMCVCVYVCIYKNVLPQI